MSLVSIVKEQKRPSVKVIGDMVHRAIHLIGGIDTIICPEDRVVIKPNVVVDRSSQTGTTTDPRIIYSIIDLLQNLGVQDITIAESTWNLGPDTMKAFELTGIKKIAEKTGVKIIDLRKDKEMMTIIPNGKVIKKIGIPRTIYESDAVINVPKMKIHDQFPATLGLKNIGVGALLDRGKRKLHRLGLSQGIVDVNKVIPTSLTVIDGIVGMEGFGPVDGDSVELGLVVSGTDPVAVDAVAASIMGIDPFSIEYIKLADEDGLGIADLNQIVTVGSTIEEVRYNFIRPEIDFREIKGLEFCYDGTCDVCRTNVVTLIEDLRRSGDLHLLDGLTIVSGENGKIPDKPKGEIILIGNCMKYNRDRGLFIPGCCPQMHRVKKEISKFRARELLSK